MRLVETTTIRGFHPYEIPPDRLTELLATPAFAQLTALAFQLSVDPSETAAATFYERLAHSPALQRMRHLTLDTNYFGSGL